MNAKTELQNLKKVARSTEGVIATQHLIKANRIHALEKKIYELKSQLAKTIKSIQQEIELTRNKPIKKRNRPDDSSNRVSSAFQQAPVRPYRFNRKNKHAEKTGPDH